MVCVRRMHLTRCHETAAFCSCWLPIRSINSLTLLSIQPPILTSPSLTLPYCHHPAYDGHHDYVATCCYGNHLLGNQFPNGHHTVASLGKEINNWEQGGFLLLLLFFDITVVFFVHNIKRKTLLNPQYPLKKVQSNG